MSDRTERASRCICTRVSMLMGRGRGSSSSVGTFRRPGAVQCWSRAPRGVRSPSGVARLRLLPRNLFARERSFPLVRGRATKGEAGVVGFFSAAREEIMLSRLRERTEAWVDRPRERVRTRRRREEMAPRDSSRRSAAGFRERLRPRRGEGGDRCGEGGVVLRRSMREDCVTLACGVEVLERCPSSSSVASSGEGRVDASGGTSTGLRWRRCLVEEAAFCAFLRDSSVSTRECARAFMRPLPLDRGKVGAGSSGAAAPSGQTLLTRAASACSRGVLSSSSEKGLPKVVLTVRRTFPRMFRSSQGRAKAGA
mmetsp:Transcript_6527/g.14098  ORF Transcript_6527/g.14098 Transcript_6527/m.14098 type:complete len:310 (-) Transcript_6527:1189-2118(-)